MRELTAHLLEEHKDGAVVRVSCRLSEVGGILDLLPAPAVARAGSGVCYGYYPEAAKMNAKGVIEFAPQKVRESADLWPAPGSDFAMMKKVKEMFDPRGLLNRGRLYGRI